MKQGKHTIDNRNVGTVGRPLRAYNKAGIISGSPADNSVAGKLRSKASPMELISWARERHAYYSTVGSEFLSKIGVEFTVPDFRLVAKNSRCAGTAWPYQKYIEYNLPYILSSKEYYEQTIAHEVAHIVAWKMDYHSSSHGDMFYFVLGDVFDKKRMKHHCMCIDSSHVQRAKAICKLIDLKKGIDNESL